MVGGENPFLLSPVNNEKLRPVDYSFLGKRG
jgi:hypothetical protein